MSFHIEDRGNGIKWVQIDSPVMRDIAQWCRDTGCGKQVTYKQICFKNDEEITMFLMRWGHDNSLR